ncbi:transglutaminase domain-containing protein [Gemmatimonas aurantiaca]|nr:transglutaminase domain-containing protein [Gemmatimonas aurantiaca]
MNTKRNLYFGSLALLAVSLATFGIGMFAETPDSRTFTMTYTITVDSLPADAKSIAILAPLPSSTETQEILNYTVESSAPSQELFESEYNNRALLFSYDSATTKQFLNDARITITIHARSIASSPLQRDAYLHPLPEEELARYLQPDKLVPLDGPIRAEAERIIPENAQDLTKIRTIYDHLCETMRYDKTGDGWGNGDALYACDIRRGNCTDIHSLFIALARIAGVPARFVIGFPLSEKESATIPGYHCWAEFYLPTAGWIPVDVSEAIKHPALQEFYFGNLDPHRIAFSYGRDINFAKANLKETLNYFVYPIVAVNQSVHSAVSVTVSYNNQKLMN